MVKPGQIIAVRISAGKGTPGKNIFGEEVPSIRGNEVDFAVKEKTKIKQLIQVCYNLDNPTIEKREIKTLLQSSKELKCNNLLVITWDIEQEKKIKRKTIKFVSLWKWLLNNK